SIFQPGARDRDGEAGGDGVDSRAGGLWTRRARAGRRMVGSETRQILPGDRPDLLWAAETARGAGARDLAYRPALSAMDDAARNGRYRFRAAALRSGFPRSARAAPGSGRQDARSQFGA